VSGKFTAGHHLVSHCENITCMACFHEPDPDGCEGCAEDKRRREAPPHPDDNVVKHVDAKRGVITIGRRG
jgi:hypothetical protein